MRRFVLIMYYHFCSVGYHLGSGKRKGTLALQRSSRRSSCRRIIDESMEWSRWKASLQHKQARGDLPPALTHKLRHLLNPVQSLPLPSFSEFSSHDAFAHSLPH
jgi:hypothetical protein